MNVIYMCKEATVIALTCSIWCPISCLWASCHIKGDDVKHFVSRSYFFNFEMLLSSSMFFSTRPKQSFVRVRGFCCLGCCSATLPLDYYFCKRPRARDFRISPSPSELLEGFDLCREVLSLCIVEEYFQWTSHLGFCGNLTQVPRRRNATQAAHFVPCTKAFSYFSKKYWLRYLFTTCCDDRFFDIFFWWFSAHL